jgi:hypothetical protein
LSINPLRMDQALPQQPLPGVHLKVFPEKPANLER